MTVHRFSLPVTPESRTQVAVFVSKGGVMEVHDNVVLLANAAGASGGAVSLTFENGSHLPIGVLRDTLDQGTFDSLRQLLLVCEARMLIEVSWEGGIADANA